jgi:hypothetical protein
MQKPYATVKCVMDDDHSGAIVETNIGWVHISCVNWLPELYFTNKDKTEVHGKIWDSRKNRKCSLTNKKAVCIQCDYQDCTKQFGIRAAMKKELIRDWEEMDENRT